MIQAIQASLQSNRTAGTQLSQELLALGGSGRCDPTARIENVGIYQSCMVENAEPPRHAGRAALASTFPLRTMLLLTT